MTLTSRIILVYWERYAMGKSVRTGNYAAMAIFLLFLTSSVLSSAAQTVESMLKGVVKVTASTYEGKKKVGTGFIVRLESDAVYIMTASHVVAGARHTEIEFFTRKNRPIPGKVIGTEALDPRGLAAVLVEQDIPKGLSVLRLSSSVRAGAGDPVTTIGFPRISEVPWAVTRGGIVGRVGKTISFSAPVDEGNSGGPLIKDNQVIGIVTEVKDKFAYATPALIAQLSLDGWGIKPVPEVFKALVYGWATVEGLWRIENETHFATGIRGFNKSYLETKTYRNLSYEVEFRKTSNNDGPLGLLIRYDPGRDIGYLLLVWPHGDYQFSILTRETRERLASGQYPRPAVHKGGAWNTATITAVGSRFTIEINGSRVASFEHNRLDAGKVGLVIHGTSKNTAEFRNLRITPR
jgi:hypothetical protein